MSRILVVDDEPLIVEIITETLSPDGHQIQKAYNGEDAMAWLNKEPEPPDLVLLDLMLPGMDGLEVSRQMQQDARLNHIPVIMLTAKNDRKKGYEKGADDYITKPFDPDELLLRVRTQLQHLQTEDESSLTKLPGPAQVEAEIRERTTDPNGDWAIIYLDIENFRAYTQAYSFAQGNKLARQAASCIATALEETGNADDFLGHMGGAEFVIVTSMDRSHPITELAADLFNKRVPGFFNKQDQTKGSFSSISVRGDIVRVPLVFLSYDIVDNSVD